MIMRRDFLRGAFIAPTITFQVQLQQNIWLNDLCLELTRQLDNSLAKYQYFQIENVWYAAINRQQNTFSVFVPLKGFDTIELKVKYFVDNIDQAYIIDWLQKRYNVEVKPDNRSIFYINLKTDYDFNKFKLFDSKNIVFADVRKGQILRSTSLELATVKQRPHEIMELVSMILDVSEVYVYEQK